MINYTANYFDIRVLKISDIKLHETTEFFRLRNIFDRIEKSRYLMNPVIVGKQNSHYLLIDGANRLSSLMRLGCKLIVAQVIRYSNSKIRLTNWDHLIYNITPAEIKNFCDNTGIKYEKIAYSKGLRTLRHNLNYILAADTSDNENLLIKLSPRFSELVEQLNSFTKNYINIYPFDRSEGEISISEIRAYSRKKGVLIKFPHFKKRHIVRISKEAGKIPSGITRHILVNRVLHVKYDLKNLYDEKDIELKTKELERYLLNKIDNNKVRQYKESVIVFDE